ncbi:MAG: branched-chain amino acid ABC transporter permease [Acidimicrobiia bacterium]
MREVLQVTIDALSIGSMFALFSLGIALVFGIMGLINFAHGELIMAGGFVLLITIGIATPVRVLAVLVVTVVLALIMERAAFRPVRGAPADTLLVTSFAVSIFLQSLAILIFGSLPTSVGIFLNLSAPVSIFGYQVRGLDLLTISVTAVLLVGLVLFLKRTSAGIQMRAAAENFTMARLLGVKANRVVALAFAMSGFLAGVAAIMFVAQTGLISPTAGLSPVLAAFVATIIGGLGTLTGAVLGGYALGAITVLLQVTLPEDLRPFRDAFVFFALVIILLVRPQGLLGRREQRV